MGYFCHGDGEGTHLTLQDDSVSTYTRLECGWGQEASQRQNQTENKSPPLVLSVLGSWESAMHKVGRYLVSELLVLYLEKCLGVQRCWTQGFNLFDP